MLERLSPSTRTVLRVGAGIAIGIAAGFAGAVIGAGLAVASVVWGAIGWNRRVLVRVTGTVAGLASLVVLLVMSGF